MTDPKMHITTSVPGLKDKIKTNITGAADVIHWYIRFNIPLDETTVSHHTMQVADTDGYIMRTDISYQTSENRICISPLDSYEENRYYLLYISKKVCSARGQPLKTKIHILFKLYKAQVSEYKVMRQDVDLPKPRERPANYDELQANRVPNAIDTVYGDALGKERPSSNDPMATVAIKMNFWTGLAGLVLVLMGFAVQQLWLVALAAGVCILGAGHLLAQLRNKEMASKILYNKGVRYFNQKHYTQAREAFTQAGQSNPGSELAKYGLFRTEQHK
ncbi:MAG: tetratricopeptide repeat protein [Defluviitaleaceae bacterium]|nr:tetratricopeptide repeat protein [Defluviitaleaceae bacterium]MCL2240251.1 tetratricopeptide repeat protein [Defluviitaleaceae bacterium]